MPAALAEFYSVGGAVPADARCYVVRSCDEQLLQTLRSGEFCYVLTSRQMGKSSLVARTSRTLAEEGIANVVIDLTKFGKELSAAQWYFELVRTIGNNFDISGEVLDSWKKEAASSPLVRFTTAIENVVLKLIPGRIVIFVDEIDLVQALPFDTDEFLAAIRELYNRRAVEPDLYRIAFCLLGVASPSDLIADPRTTPFNIGVRIQLHDFSESEAAVLVNGLPSQIRGNQAILNRALYWTGGHPYLTQSLFRSLAALDWTGARVHNDPRKQVDALVRDLFFSNQAREKDDNLGFVQNFIQSPLKGLTEDRDSRVVAVLSVYRSLFGPFRVMYVHRTPELEQLLLSGIIKIVNDRLVVRNRIYRRVFNRQWAFDNMPDKIARQRRRLLRIATISGCATLVLAVNIGALEIKQKQLTHALQVETAARFAATSESMEQTNPSLAALLSVKGFSLDPTQWWTADALLRMAQEPRILTYLQTPDDQHGSCFSLTPLNLGKKHLVAGGFADGRIQLFDLDAPRSPPESLNPAAGSIYSVAFSASNRILACSGDKGDVVLYALSDSGTPTGAPVRYSASTQPIRSIAFCMQGGWLAAAGDEGKIVLKDILRPSTPPLTLAKDTDSAIRTLACNSSGSLLAAGGNDHLLRLYDLKSLKGGQRASDLKRVHEGSVTLPAFEGVVDALAFDPRPGEDGHEILGVGEDGGGNSNIDFWDVVSMKKYGATLTGHTSDVMALAFSPDGALLFSAGRDQSVRIWDAIGQRPIDNSPTLQGHHTTVEAVAACSDAFGRTRIVSGGYDQNVILWSADSVSRLSSFVPEHEAAILSSRFTNKGQEMITAATSGDVECRDPLTGWVSARVKQPQRMLWDSGLSTLQVQPGGKLIATGDNDGFIRFWNSHTLAPVTDRFEVSTKAVLALAFSHDGSILAESDSDYHISLWDVASLLKGNPRHKSLPCYDGSAESMAFNGDGSLFVVGTSEGSVLVYGAKRFDRLDSSQYDLFDYDVNALAFSPNDPHLLLAADAYGYVKFIRLDSAKSEVIYSPREFKPAANRATFSPDGQLALVGMSNGDLVAFSVSNGKPAGLPLTLQGADPNHAGRKLFHTNEVQGVAFLQNSAAGGRKLAASCDLSGTTLLWDLTDLKHPLARIIQSGPNRSFEAVAVIPGENALVTADFNSRLYYWRALQPSLFAFRQTGFSAGYFEQGANSASIGEDGQLVAFGCGGILGRYSENSRELSMRSGVLLRKLDWNDPSKERRTFIPTDNGTTKAPSAHLSGQGVIRVALSPDEQKLAFTVRDGNLEMYSVRDIQRPRQVWQARPPSGSYFAITFSPDGRIVACGGGDHSDYAIRLFDADSGRELGPALFGHTAAVTALTFSPDGAMLASGSADNTVRTWDLKKWQQIEPLLSGHINTVWAVAFDPARPNWLATASADETFRLWDLNSRLQIGGNFTDHGNSQVWSVAFDPTGRVMATGSIRGIVMTNTNVDASPNNLESKPWTQWVEEMSNRVPSPDEWKRLVGRRAAEYLTAN